VSDSKTTKFSLPVDASVICRECHVPGGWHISVTPLQEEVVRSSRRTLLVLLFAVGLLLLIACANVANLLLMRSAKRQKELAIRAALGASRWQIARQLLVEGLLLATLAAALGFVFVSWGIRALALLGLALIFPGEAVHQQRKAVVGLSKAHVTDADDGILGGGGNDVEVFVIERQQFEIGHRDVSGNVGVRAQMGVGGTMYKH